MLPMVRFPWWRALKNRRYAEELPAMRIGEEPSGQDQRNPGNERQNRQRLGSAGKRATFNLANAQDGADAMDEEERKGNQAEFYVEQRVGECLGRIGDQQQGSGDGVDREGEPYHRQKSGQRLERDGRREAQKTKVDRCAAAGQES